MLDKVFYTSVLVSDQDKALDSYASVALGAAEIEHLG